MSPSTPTVQRVFRRVRLAFVASALAGAALLAPAGASADEPGGDTTIAQTLFEEGRRLMEAKQFVEACPKFEESQRLRPGTGTLLNLALCSEALGKTATAWGHFKEVLFASKKENNEAREAFAQEHLSVLEPKLSKLVVKAESTPGLAIRRDGQEIPAAALGTPIPVDPGTHEIEATAPGYSVWSTTVKVGDSADLKTIAIPKLTPAPIAKPIEKPPPAAPSAGRGSALRTAGFVIGGAGVAALGVGAVFGLLASGQASDAETDPSLCPKKACSPEGRDEIDAASTKALVSTIAVGVGVAAVGAGAVLILTSGRSKATAEARRTSKPAIREVARPQHGWIQGTARVVPVFGPEGGGAVVLGAF
jgi:hypothetical protein